MPFDLSDETGQDKPVQLPTSNLPTGRASDVLRPQTPPPGAYSSIAPLPLTERPVTPLDDAASVVFWLSLVVTVIGLAYLLWGVWSGMLAEPNFSHSYSHEDRLRIVGNLGLVETVVKFSTMVTLATMLFLFYDNESTGYLLVGTALVLNIGVPWLSQFFLGMIKATPGPKTTTPVIAYIQTLAYFPGVPGLLLTIWDIIRRMLVGLQQSKIRKATLRYGQNAMQQQAKRRNVFLGRCWNLPYCRETIRTRCPVYIKRLKPCWQHKMGCMCDEHIAVLANAGDWKAAVSTAMAHLEGRAVQQPGNPVLGIAGSPKIQLSMAEKKQRCRECVIYNTHQEHKYKLLVGILVGGTVLVLYQFNSHFISGIGSLFINLNSLLGRFSLTNNGGAGVFQDNISGTVAWFVLIVLTVLIVSKLLQLVEYCVFNLKI